MADLHGIASERVNEQCIMGTVGKDRDQWLLAQILCDGLYEMLCFTSWSPGGAKDKGQCVRFIMRMKLERRGLFN